MNKQSKVMLAVDGGGTKTEFLLFDETGNILHHTQLSGSNPNSYGMDSSIKVLHDGLKLMLSKTEGLSSVYFGVAGFGDPANKSAILSYFEKSYPSLSFLAEPDYYNIINSCTPSETYISAICGTGSVVCAVTKTGIERMGGYGYLFDRSLCGYTLGRDAIYTALREEDGLQKESKLTYLLQKHFGGLVHNNINLIYTSGKEYIADMARLVFEAYDMGDNAAKEIIKNSIIELSFLVNSAIAMYGTKRIVTLSGGLIKRSDILIPLLNEYCKNTEFITADMPQIYGAAVYCCSQFADLSDNFKSNIKNKLRKETGHAKNRDAQ